MNHAFPVKRCDHLHGLKFFTVAEANQHHFKHEFLNKALKCTTSYIVVVLLNIFTMKITKSNEKQHFTG